MSSQQNALHKGYIYQSWECSWLFRYDTYTCLD